jgi:hypothetical protein
MRINQSINYNTAIIIFSEFCAGKVVENRGNEALAPKKRGKSYFPLTYPIASPQQQTTEYCYRLRDSVRG